MQKFGVSVCEPNEFNSFTCLLDSIFWAFQVEVLYTLGLAGNASLPSLLLHNQLHRGKYNDSFSKTPDSIVKTSK